ncbi:nucleotidyltransferase family protein [Paenibacillus sp. N4]|uniref:nucleotidyltransferase domain-containing protein n=1 Tax=Paenibacillus vietnamensis TaxID=2590547 RepID=UPI001CD12771|nr:nucleotidyltransferase family protein [Paenibacillus vietnamensis]MCA0756744.1 nucleotidyltransferase family protein [Paenibacillus vietnamensis]
MIWKLLQAVYDPNAPFPVDPGIFEAALADIEYFHISPQLYQLLKQQGKLESLPVTFRNRLKSKYDEALALNVYIQYENERIFKAFEAAGISVIPIKGVLFANKYFGHIGARSTSDIDLLIQPADMSRAEAIVRSLGFTNAEPQIRSHFHRSLSKPLPAPLPSLTVELHWDLLMAGTSAFGIGDFWRDALPLEPYSRVMELSEYHTFYMICLHGWKHGLNSLKYLIDIVQLIHVKGDDLPFDTLLRDAASHRTYKRICSTLSIVYRQFPFLERRKPLPLPASRRSGEWWSYDSIRGTEKRSFKRYVRLLQFQWFDFDKPWHGIAASVHYLEPSLRNRKGV